MPEQLQKIINKIVEWWNKFDKKQKILLASITGVVLVALVILAVVVSRPNYSLLTTVEKASDASTVQKLLTDEGIAFNTSQDGMSFYVKDGDMANAHILLGSNDIPSEGYDITDAVDGSFSMTSGDRQKKYIAYLEKKIATDLEEIDAVDSATVTLNVPEEDGTILSSEKESSCSVTLGLNDKLGDEQATSLARYVATALGDYTTDKITIVDRATANVLYSGADESNNGGIASTQLSAIQKREQNVSNQVKKVLVDSKVFSDVQCGVSLNMTFDNSEKATHKYSTMDGTNKGPITSRKEYTSSATGGAAAEPGTDSNDDTTYVVEDGAITRQEVNEVSENYATDEEIVKTTSSGGQVDLSTSSISVVANRYRVYDEAQMKANGELDNTTWEEFKAQNANPVEIQDEGNVYTDLIARASGIDAANISFRCYEQPTFVDDEGAGFGINEILQIVLAVLIFALLGYVVFRSTRAAKKAEEEEELVVEPLLESVQEPEEELEDIGYSEKSETRLLIEKFVDENPEAAALLLRNWLNEDWG